MLRHTFCHIRGVGPKTETGLWEAGVRCWDDALKQDRAAALRRRSEEFFRAVAESAERLTAGDAPFFAAALPAAHHWRLLPHFPDATGYLDIETTGLREFGDHVTTVAVYDGNAVHTFVHGETMSDLEAHLARYRMLVTYNGKSFDMPFLTRTLGIRFEQAHVDLRHLLHRLGYRGGLKQIEHQLGLARDGVEDIDGAFAVLLWHDYVRSGDRRALDTLLAYNAMDVVNLAPLAAITYNLCLAATPFADGCSVPVPDVLPPMPFAPDPATIARLCRAPAMAVGPPPAPPPAPLAEEAPKPRARATAPRPSRTPETVDPELLFGAVVMVGIDTTGDDPHRDRLLAVHASARQCGQPPAAFHGRWPHCVEDDPAALPEEALAFLEFLPDREDVLVAAFDGGRVAAFLQANTAGLFQARVLDLTELAAVCLPTTPPGSLTGADHDRPRAENPGERACLAAWNVWERCLAAAVALPDFALNHINRLLQVLGSDPRREVFRRLATVARDHGGDDRPGSFEALFKRPRPRSNRPAEAGEQWQALEPERLAGLFGPDGRLAARMATFEQRPEQLAMMTAVTDAFNYGQMLLAEAGTGIGKSLAYLVPSAAWAITNRTPVIVSTNTKNLQAQLFEKDLPLVREALGRDFRAAIIKGRRNYLCLRKLSYILRHAAAELGRDDRADVAAVLVWACNTTTGDISEALFGEGERYATVRAQVTSAGDECPGSACRQRSGCLLRHQRRLALAADVVVTNHSLVFAEMGLRESTALPPFYHIIFDEAHNLEDAATHHFAVELSLGKARAMLRRLWRPSQRRRRGGGDGTGLVPSILAQFRRQAEDAWVAPALALAEALLSQLEQLQPPQPFFDALAAWLQAGRGGESRRIRPTDLDHPMWADLLQARERMVSALAPAGRIARDLAEAMRRVDPYDYPEVSDFTVELDGCLQGLREFVEAAGFVLAANDPEYVYWVERVPERLGKARAWAAPIQVGPHLARDLYPQKSSIVFTSATLAVCRSSQFIKHRLGIDLLDPERLAERALGTPFDYPRQCLVMAPTFLPEPGDRQRDYASELGALLAQLLPRTGGRALVLFTSYDMLRRTTALLRTELDGVDIPLLVQGESGSREHITDRFRRFPRSVLMGTHSFWEGVDIPGESLSCLVIARLPFAVFTDPVVEARCDRIQEEGQDPFSGYSVPNAVIRFRQGFGRLIRHRTDRGVVIVADRRIITKRYGRWFQNSLPAPVRAVPDADQLLSATTAFLADV